MTKEEENRVKRLHTVVATNDEITKMSLAVQQLVEENRFLKDFTLKQFDEIDQLKKVIAKLKHEKEKVL